MIAPLLVAIGMLAPCTELMPLVVPSYYAAAPARPGDPWLVATRLTMRKGWHVYWLNPGDSGYRTSMSLQLPRGANAQPTEYEAPQRFNGTAGSTTYGYEKEGWLFTPVTASKGARGKLKIQLRWLACTEEECVPGEDAYVTTWPPRDDDKHVHTERAARVPAAAAAESAATREGTEDVFIHVDGTPAGTAAFFPDLPAGWTVVNVAPAETSGTRIHLRGRAAPKDGLLRGVLVTTQDNRRDARWVHARFP